MSELSIARIERIERALMSRRLKKRELTAVQKFDRFMVVMVLAGGFLILSALLLVKAEWSPGNQMQIANEYRALRHNAVAMEEPK